MKESAIHLMTETSFRQDQIEVVEAKEFVIGEFCVNSFYV